MLALTTTLNLILLGGALFVAVWRRSSRLGEPMPWIYYLFFFSGFPALIYQIVWERALFTLYGVNIESVTVVVTGFLLGLGLGSLVGGFLSQIPGLPLLALFGAAELSTAVYGIFSLRLFHAVGQYTAGISLFGTTSISFTLLLIPTMLMGSTLPMLVAYSVRRSRNVGGSLGLLYFVNTLGSAAACFLAAALIMMLLGQSGSVAVGAAINATVGIGGLAAWYLNRTPVLAASRAELHCCDGDSRRIRSHAQPTGCRNIRRRRGICGAGLRDTMVPIVLVLVGLGRQSLRIPVGSILEGNRGGRSGCARSDQPHREHRSKRQYLRLIAWFVVLANLSRLRCGSCDGPGGGVPVRFICDDNRGGRRRASGGYFSADLAHCNFER